MKKTRRRKPKYQKPPRLKCGDFEIRYQEKYELDYDGKSFVVFYDGVEVCHFRSHIILEQFGLAPFWFLSISKDRHRIGGPAFLERVRAYEKYLEASST